MAYHHRFNREILASITFEPQPKKGKTVSTAYVAPPTAAGGQTQLPLAATAALNSSTNNNSATLERGQSNLSMRPDESETQLIIACMKLALAKSISSISVPDKDRPLDPRKDFTIASSIAFRKRKNDDKQRRRSGGGGGSSGGASRSCCSASVKERQPPLGHSLSIHSRESSPFTTNMTPVYPPGNEMNATSRQQLRLHDGEDVEGSDDDDDEDGSDDDDCNIGGLPRAPAPFTFIDYSPMCYRHIREFFGIDAESYRQVLVQSTWHSVPTPGKSAAQLFFCGQNWVIKTMTNQESDFLRDMLHKYYYHARDNPYTLLPHFVGHHRIELNGKQLTFVIMQNVFATTNKIHEKYDLKGSTVGRFATKAEKMKQTCTQKDLDINRPILIGPQRRMLVVEQMKKDCDFLKRSSIMDYSLLVGIHVVPSHKEAAAQPAGQQMSNPAESPQVESLDPQAAAAAGAATSAAVGGGGGGVCYLDGRCFTADHGGMMCSDDVNGRQEIYYLGIIDILQEYTLWKRSETVVQGVLHDMHRISAVHPIEYASRFLSFMSSLLV